MRTERLRELFSQFLKENEIDNSLSCNSCITLDQDESLKYERIDKYSVLFLTYQNLKKLLAFCDRHSISVWFDADKLCIGFNYKGNMRLSAYDSVHADRSDLECQEDRNNSVRVPEAAASSQGDRNDMSVHIVIKCPHTASMYIE